MRKKLSGEDEQEIVQGNPDAALVRSEEMASTLLVPRETHIYVCVFVTLLYVDILDLLLVLNFLCLIL